MIKLQDQPESKLKSRKLWVLIMSAVIVALGQKFNLGPEFIDFVQAMAMTFIGGQAAVDISANVVAAVKAKKEGA